MKNSKALQEFIANSVDLILKEKLRGTFSWEEFKRFNGLKALNIYALRTLGKPLGKGSSRAVYTLSSSKVLKLARPEPDASEKGLAQNEAELEVWTNPLIKPIVAKIYDYDPKYRWIVSEITRPFARRSNMEQAIGSDSTMFEEILYYVLTKNFNSFNEGLESYRKRQEALLERSRQLMQELEARKANPNDRSAFGYKSQEESLGWDIYEASRRLDAVSGLSPKIKTLLTGLVELKNKTGFNVDDLARLDHYGLTADGRIVIIDYGYNREIGRKFYDRSSGYSFSVTESYKGIHKAPGPGRGAPLHDITNEIYPDDIYTLPVELAARFYGVGEFISDLKVMKMVRKYHNKPSEMVIVYRAVPNSEDITEINPGDWVTIYRPYAKLHGEGPLSGDYKIISLEVLASSLYTDGNSIYEWGYYP